MSESNEPKQPLSVYAVLPYVIEQMAGIAWQKLGLQSDPMTGTIHQDLVEAKVAIDVVAYLATALEGQLDEDDRRQMHSLVRDLRINYVQKSSN